MPCVHKVLALKVLSPYVAVLVLLVSSLVKQSFAGWGRKTNKVSCFPYKCA